MPRAVAQWAKQAIACMLMPSWQSDDMELDMEPDDVEPDDMGHGMSPPWDGISPAEEDIAVPISALIPAATTWCATALIISSTAVIVAIQRRHDRNGIH
jgi:hypothetical protein